MSTAKHSPHPVNFYLDQLSTDSKRTMKHSLVSFVTWAQGGGTSIYDYPWNQLTKKQLNSYKSALVQCGTAPSTINSRISAVRGVLRHCVYNIDTPDSLRMSREVFDRIVEVSTIQLASQPKPAIDESVIVKAIENLPDSAQGARDAALLRVVWSLGLSASKVGAIGYAKDITGLSKLLDRYSYIYTPGYGGLLISEPCAQQVSVSSMPLIELDNKTIDALDHWQEAYLKQSFGPLFVRIRSNTNIDKNAVLGASSVFYILKRIKKQNNQPLISMRYLSRTSNKSMD